LIVEEWVNTIRDAIIALTARAPTTTPIKKGGKPISVSALSYLIFVPWFLVALVMFAVAVGSHHWTDNLWSIVGVAFFLILPLTVMPIWVRRNLRRWSTAAAGSAASRGPQSTWWFVPLLLAVYGGFGLEYTKHIVRQGAGFWVPEAMAAALSHRPEFTVPLIVGTVWLLILALRMPLPASRPAFLKRLLGLKIVPALAIIVLLRTYILQPFSVPNDSAAPEIPKGSHIIVWKLSDTFAPGEMIAYSHTGQTFVGRVVSNSGDIVNVNRNNQPDLAVQRVCIEGKVLSVFWRGSSTANSRASDVQSPVINSNH
jgi:hypothetical protein